MAIFRSPDAARRPRSTRARGAYLRVVRWFDAPRLVRTRRRRRAALAAATLAAGTALQIVLPSAAPLVSLAPVAAGVCAAAPGDPPRHAPLALTFRTTIPTPLAGARVHLRLDVVNSGGWRVVVGVHLEPAPLPGLVTYR